MMMRSELTRVAGWIGGQLATGWAVVWCGFAGLLSFHQVLAVQCGAGNLLEDAGVDVRQQGAGAEHWRDQLLLQALVRCQALPQAVLAVLLQGGAGLAELALLISSIGAEEVVVPVELHVVILQQDVRHVAQLVLLGQGLAAANPGLHGGGLRRCWQRLEVLHQTLAELIVKQQRLWVKPVLRLSEALQHVGRQNLGEQQQKPGQKE